SGISNGCCLPTCSTTTRTGLTSDSRRTRQQVGLEVLESAARDPQSFARDPNGMIHLYAMYLLAQFRETRAYPLLVQMFSAPGELPFDLAGDTVTESLDSILASVSDGDMTGMASLVENERANEYVRSAALKGLVTLVACGKRSRDEVVAY